MLIQGLPQSITEVKNISTSLITIGECNFVDEIKASKFTKRIDLSLMRRPWATSGKSAKVSSAGIRIQTQVSPRRSESNIFWEAVKIAEGKFVFVFDG